MIVRPSRPSKTLPWHWRPLPRCFRRLGPTWPWQSCPEACHLLQSCLCPTQSSGTSCRWVVSGLSQSSLCASRWSASWRELGAELSSLLPSSPVTWKPPNIFRLWGGRDVVKKPLWDWMVHVKGLQFRPVRSIPAKGNSFHRDEVDEHPFKGSSGQSKMQEAESAVRAGVSFWSISFSGAVVKSRAAYQADTLLHFSRDVSFYLGINLRKSTMRKMLWTGFKERHLLSDSQKIRQNYFYELLTRELSRFFHAMKGSLHGWVSSHFLLPETPIGWIWSLIIS